MFKISAEDTRKLEEKQTKYWFGVAYKEDKEAVVESFRKLIKDGMYGEELYRDVTIVKD